MLPLHLYFQLHQPIRLKNYDFTLIGTDHMYHHDELNIQVLNRVVDRCYLPMTRLLTRLARETSGRLRFNFSISGICLEQIETHRPDALQALKDLHNTGSLEFLAETYYHSLASQFSDEEFQTQVKQQEATLLRLFNAQPKVFRNTELIYDNPLEQSLEKLQYPYLITEAAPQVLEGRNPNHLYKDATGHLKILLRNHELSDIIAFKFSDVNWEFYPITADDFHEWLQEEAEIAQYLTLGMDYETFGEHRIHETGIFEFIEHILRHCDKDPQIQTQFLSQTFEQSPYPQDNFSAPNPISWADEARNTDHWCGNPLQTDALEKLYNIRDKVLETQHNGIIDTWRKLQTSDHFYYMSTQYGNNPVHQSFSHYDSPYDAYINFMNVLTDFERNLETFRFTRFV